MKTAGPDKSLTLADLDAVLADNQDIHERRLQNRIAVRTRVQVICLSLQSSTVRSVMNVGWSEEVSASGAKLLLPQSVAADRFWVRFPGSARQDAFFDCRVQWRETDSTPAMTGRSESLHRCGVQFQRLLTREEFDKVLAEDHSASQPQSCLEQGVENAHGG